MVQSLLIKMILVIMREVGVALFICLFKGCQDLQEMKGKERADGVGWK